MTQGHLIMRNFSRINKNQPPALRLSVKRHPFTFLKILDRKALPGKCKAAIFPESWITHRVQIVLTYIYISKCILIYYVLVRYVMRRIYFPIRYIFNLSAAGSNSINLTVTQIAWNLSYNYIYFQIQLVQKGCPSKSKI